MAANDNAAYDNSDAACANASFTLLCDDPSGSVASEDDCSALAEATGTTATGE